MPAPTQRRPPMKFIEFGDRYSTYNPPARATMLALDPQTRSLYVYRNGKAYAIDDKVTERLLNSDGKLKPQLVPSSFSTTAWVQKKIQQKVSTVFRLRGFKDTSADIKRIKNPRVGDVWISRQSGCEYVYTNQSKWEQLGGLFSIDTQRLDQLYSFVNRLSESVSLISAAVQDGFQAVSGELDGQQQQIQTLSATVNNHSTNIQSLQEVVTTDIPQSITNIQTMIAEQQINCETRIGDNIKEYDDTINRFQHDLQVINDSIGSIQ